MVSQDHVTKYYISNTTVPMVTKLGRMVTNFHVTMWNHYISTTTKSMTTKRGRVVIYNEELPIIVTYSLSHVVWWCHMTYDILYISTCTRPTITKDGEVVNHCKGLPPINLHNPLCSREVKWQLKTLHHHYQNAYGHKNYQGGDITQGAPIHKFTGLLNVVFMGGHVTI